MAIKPILFNTEMVRAILEGRKTQTRRLLKPKYRPEEDGFQIITNANTGKFVRVEYCDEDGNETRWMAPPCEVGDILWVRETWHKDAGRYMYKANYADGEKFYRNGKEVTLRWRPSIHMPKEAARIFLRVNDVRVEKLNDLLDHAGEVAKEGIPYSDEWDIEASCLRFKELWESTIKPADRDVYGWYANPWVWVIEFERVEKPKGW